MACRSSAASSSPISTLGAPPRRRRDAPGRPAAAPLGCAPPTLPFPPRLAPLLLRHYDNCVRYRDGFYDVAYGRDECCIAGLAVGAQGHIGNAFNYCAGLFERIRAAFAKGDMKTARMEQGRANAVINMLFSGKYSPTSLAVNREIMELKGIKLGPPRMPIIAMTDAQKAALKADLTAMGFFEWCD